MLRLPGSPLKVTLVGDGNSFVTEALRKRGVNEECWCNSGIKYKKCHLKRHQGTRFVFGEAFHEMDAILWKSRGCLHPNASPHNCSGKVIDSHTIQRKGVLEKIVNDSNHVHNLKPNFKDHTKSLVVEVTKVGWKKASTFPGYCAKHDAEFFSKIETAPFVGTHEQCVLQSYRATCNEMYKRQGLIDSLYYQKTILDRGMSLDEQISIQISIDKSIENSQKSLEELIALKKKFENAILNNKLDLFQSICYFFDGDFGIVSSGILQAEFTFDGARVSDVWDLSIDTYAIAHSVMSTNKGGAFFFCWEAGSTECKSVIDSFEKIDDKFKCDIFAQYCFLSCENTYFSEKWWENLSEQSRNLLKKYFSVTYYEGGAFVPSKKSLVDWKIIGRTASI